MVTCRCTLNTSDPSAHTSYLLLFNLLRITPFKAPKKLRTFRTEGCDIIAFLNLFASFFVTNYFNRLKGASLSFTLISEGCVLSLKKFPLQAFFLNLSI